MKIEILEIGKFENWKIRISEIGKFELWKLRIKFGNQNFKELFKDGILKINK